MPARLRSGAATPRASIDDMPLTAKDFPRQAGSVLKTSKRDTGLISPTKETFSFQEEEEEEDDSPRHALSALPDLIDEKQIAQHVTRGAPGDASLMNMVKRNESTRDGKRESERKSQFWGEVFAYREPNMTTKHQVHKFSPITAEIKTNVIVKDEFVLLNDLSDHLSRRYQRPLSSIFITLTHSACLLFAGTFDSAYILTISALPSAIQPVTNKRNAALHQSFMAESLGVNADRGVVRFLGVGEEYLAINGTTILGEIEAMRKNSDEDARPESAMGRTKSRRSLRPKDLQLKQRSRAGSKVTSPTPMSPTPMSPRRMSPSLTSPSKIAGQAPMSPPLKSPSLPAIPVEKTPLDIKAERVQKMGRRRSFLSMFGRKNG